MNRKRTLNHTDIHWELDNRIVIIKPSILLQITNYSLIKCNKIVINNYCFCYVIGGGGGGGGHGGGHPSIGHSSGGAPVKVIKVKFEKERILFVMEYY